MNQDSPLSILMKEPGRSALMSDVDGTLCRIVDRPDNARVPVKAKDSLETLSRELALVACVTGRPARVARRMVGAESVTYFGNHGLELLEPGKEEPEMVLEGEQITRAARFIADNDSPHWVSAKIRVEDKGPIQALPLARCRRAHRSSWSGRSPSRRGLRTWSPTGAARSLSSAPGHGRQGRCRRVTARRYRTQDRRIRG